MAVQTFTDTNFIEQVESSQGVVLVDFWAPWCVPCQSVGPTIERVAQAFERSVRVGKLNVDEHPATAARYHIRSIPTLAIFRNGRLVTTFLGVRPEPIYRRALEAALQPASALAGKTTTPPKTSKHSVTVFSTPTCSWCARLKAYLRQRHIAFKEVDVSQDERAAQDMVRRSGQMGVPQTWIDGQVVVGFDRRRVDELLGLPLA